MMSFKGEGNVQSSQDTMEGIGGKGESGGQPGVPGTVRMKRQIGLLGGISMIMGTMIGTGIFISPTGVMKEADSVATSLVVWAACGALTCLTALTYCELGTVVPRSGGEHAYLMAAFAPLHSLWGQFPAFLFSWMTVIAQRPSATAITSFTFGQYLMAPILSWMDVKDEWKDSGDYDYAKKSLAAACVLFITYLNMLSSTFGTRTQIIFTFTKITAILTLIGVGIYNMSIGKIEGLPKSYDVGDASYGQIAMAFYSGLWAYGGWYNLNMITEELINPAKNLPRGILIGIPFTTILYLLVNVAYLTSMDKQTFLNSKAVAVDVGDEAFGQFSFIIPLLVVCSTIGSVNGITFTVGRLSYAASREGHLLKVMSFVHVERLTPSIAIILNGTLAIVFIAFGDINDLIKFFAIVEWIFHALALIAVFILRRTMPDAPRPIKVPLILPIIGLVVAVFLVLAPLINAPNTQHLTILAFASVGTVLYYLFVFKQIQLRFMDQVSDIIQRLTLIAPSPYNKD